MNEVSVIIPTWNRALTLKKAIRSALAQTVPPCEVLVCDDGSTDDSKKITRAVGDDRVRWVEGPRRGRPAIPRNRGIKESKCEWLAFLDSDDEWLPEKLAKQLKLAMDLGVKAACSNAFKFLPEKGFQGMLLSDKKELFTFSDLMRENTVICSSALIHKSLFTDVYGFPEEEHMKAMEDYALWLRVATISAFAFVAEPLVVYRDDASSSIRNDGFQNPLLQKKYILENFLEWTKDHPTPAYYRETAKKQYERVMKNLGNGGFRLRSVVQRIFNIREK